MTLRRFASLTALGTLMVVGCAAPMIAMVHPKTLDIKFCEAYGIGAIPAVWAQISVANCVKEFESIGYKRADELTDEERKALRPQKAPIDIEIETR